MKFRLEEIEVPEDNPFKNDALKRQPVVEFLRDLIKQLEGPFVLALDSPWGTGKTTVVRMLRSALKKETRRELGEQAKREPTTKDTIRAQELVEMLGHVSSRRFRDFSTSYVANKIDLASRVGDDR